MSFTKVRLELLIRSARVKSELSKRVTEALEPLIRSSRVKSELSKRVTEAVKKGRSKRFAKVKSVRHTEAWCRGESEGREESRREESRGREVLPAGKSWSVDSFCEKLSR